MKTFDCLKISTAIIEREMNVKRVNFKKIASLVLAVTLVLSVVGSSRSPMALQRKSRNAVKFYRIDEECECQGNWEKRIS